MNIRSINLSDVWRTRIKTNMRPGSAFDKPKPARAKRGTGRRAKEKERKRSNMMLLGIPEVPGRIEYRGHDAVMRNSWEKRFAAHLEALKRAGVITAYAYEPMRFLVGWAAWFCPDYVVRYPDGRTLCYDVKGFQREAALVRIKAAALMYPQFSWGLAKLVKGAWQVEWIGKDGDK